MTEKISTILIDTQQQSLDLLKAYLSELDFLQVNGSFSDIVKGYNTVLEERPAIVIIDISEKTELALDIVNKISINHKMCKIIVTSDNYSADLVVKSMRSGAR